MKLQRPLLLSGQKGAILVITLVIMVAMTLASIGLFRSVDTAMLLSGNIGFKRDVVARANLAIQTVLQQLQNPLFRADAADYCINPTPCSAGQNVRNYSPVLLESTADGIPTILLPANQALYNANMVGVWTTDGALKAATDAQGVSIFYVIERVCLYAGQAVQGACVFEDWRRKARAAAGDYRESASSAAGPGSGVIGPSGGANASVEPPLFKVTVRASGVRNSEAYVQAFVRPPADF